MSEFAPIEGGALTLKARQNLINIGIMPKCIVYAYDVISGLPLSVVKSHNSVRSSGFPIFDLAQQDPEESRSRYAKFKLLQVLGASVQDVSFVSSPELVSKVGPVATFDTNTHYPACTKAVY
ncbi:MAG: hypothetical protein M3Q70_02240 [bacterium]|nr:hypothetical protein [bacterium]